MAVPIDDSPARKMTIDTGRMASGLQLVRLHPNGREPAYLVGADRGEIWALENVVPR